MSTPAVPVTPAPITPASTAAEIAAANQASQTTPTPGQPPATPSAAPVAPAPPAAPAAPAPTPEYQVQDLGQGKLKVQYATGEVFEGTQQEIIDKIAKAHVHTKEWAKSQVQQAPVPTPAAPPSPFTDPQEQAVAEYTANLIAKTLGYGSATEMRSALGMIEQNSVDYGSQTTALQFQANQPDFNPTPENTDKLMQVVAQSMSDEEFGAKTREQQVHILRQAHSYCLQTGTYQAKPTGQPQTVLPPPPPAPTGREQVVVGALPPELVATMADTPEQIKAKWEKARALGLA